MKNIALLLSFIILYLSINHNLDLLAENIQLLPKSAQIILFKKFPKAKVIDRKELNQGMRDYLDEQKKLYDTVLMRDFNGDKLIDVALLIKYPNKNGIETEKLVVLLNDEDKIYKYICLEDYSLVRGDVFIRITESKKIKEFDSSRVIELKHEGIERVYFEKSAGIFYWKDKKFHYIPTVD